MEDYLQKYQPIAYQTLLNSKKNNSLAHAILLSGNETIPLLDIAKFFSATIICENNLACENCINCLRIENESFADLIIIDGEKDSIKKEEIENLQLRFSKSAIEDLGVKIYIINVIENATTQALNSLLKMLEEPEENIYAILTTANHSKVLPTIVSRCQNIHFRNVSKDEIVVESIKLGVPLEDALILSSFSGSNKKVEDIYKNSNYLNIKKIIIEYFNKIEQQEDILYFVQLEMSAIINNKEDLKMLLHLLEIAYLDLLNIESDILFISQKELFTILKNRIKFVEKKLELIMTFRGKIDYSTNIKLLLDSIFINLGGQ